MCLSIKKFLVLFDLICLFAFFLSLICCNFCVLTFSFFVLLCFLFQRLKQGTPDFHNFIRTAKKYQEQLVSLIDLGKAFSDSLMKLSTNFRGDLEDGIRKMAEAQREIERRRLEMSEHLLREVVQPLGRSVESESK